MDTKVPYMASNKNIHAILTATSRASVPETFTTTFLSNMEFRSSADRTFPRVLQYLGLLDSSRRPTALYKQFLDQTRSKTVLAQCLRRAYDELFDAHPDANTYANPRLAGWFRTKTGKGESASEKMAMTFRSLCDYADFTQTAAKPPETEAPLAEETPSESETSHKQRPLSTGRADHRELAFTYRLEIHLPDTTDVNTFRAIFRALKEELGV